MESTRIILQTIIIFGFMACPTTAFSMLMFWPFSSASEEKDCGKPPPVANEKVAGEIKSEAQALSRWLGNAELSGKIQTSREEIFSKYPNANESLFGYYFRYQICILLMSDKTLSNKEKRDELIKIQQAFSKPPPSPNDEQGKSSSKPPSLQTRYPQVIAELTSFTQPGEFVTV